MYAVPHSTIAAASQSGLRVAAWPRLGLLYVWTVPLGAAVAGMKGLRIGGLEYTGYIWFAYFVAGWFLLLTELAVRRQTRPALPVGRWLLWLGVVWGSLCWADWGWRNVQDALQISLPVLVGVMASVFVRHAADLKPLLRNCWIATFGIGGLFVAQKTGLIGALGLEVDIRACALALALFGAFFLAALPQRWLLPVAGWMGCIVLTFITGGRMATMALLATPVLHPRLRSVTLRVVAVATIACLGVGLFYSSVFQKRFFHEGSGTLTQVLQGEFLSFGRFEAWPLIFEEASNRPWQGYGVGSTRGFIPSVWDDVTLPHNDYLRIFFELGLLGLGTFALVVGWQMWSLRREMRCSHGIVRHAFAATLLGWCVFLIAAFTDNPLTYAMWVTNPLFALMGAAYGVVTRDPRSPEETSTKTDPRDQPADELEFVLVPAPYPSAEAQP